MGTPIPSPDPDFGNNCPLCTPALWADGETPEKIYAYFTGIVDCGRSPHHFPNGLTFELHQSPGNACMWVHSGDPWIIDFRPDLIAPNKSIIRLMDILGWSFFNSQGNPCPVEYTTYANQQIACIFMYAGAMGTATIFWHDEILELVAQLGFLAGPNLFYEMFNAPNSDIVHKFCDQYQRTNVKLLSDH